ncbi:hypothetical protein NEF87_002098 [Candidatus Lokiarchaeum ossiferum]|uniref:N-acetyltransferase domain-containing protein n=1 Tax=Candidatus Lokiarchaeum ossiferum TaxID=2951803 RepID=A0ABY6HR47_9ARCH|nr:hypothetical protein NEF87_002098 [Candidatus Lokiarchaeum sp. B-35]
MNLQKEYKMRNGQVLQISKANPDDAIRVIKYLNQVGGESDNLTFGENEFSKTVEQEQEFLSDLQKSNNSILILGIIDNRLISVANLSASSKSRLNHLGEIGISVRKSAWNIGVGNAIMEYLIAWAKANQIIRKINLSVRTDNQHAIELYQRFGFVKEGLMTRAMQINGQFYDTLEMGLEID